MTRNMGHPSSVDTELGTSQLSRHRTWDIPVQTTQNLGHLSSDDTEVGTSAVQPWSVVDLVPTQQQMATVDIPRAEK